MVDKQNEVLVRSDLRLIAATTVCALSSCRSVLRDLSTNSSYPSSPDSSTNTFRPRRTTCFKLHGIL